MCDQLFTLSDENMESCSSVTINKEGKSDSEKNVMSTPDPVLRHRNPVCKKHAELLKNKNINLDEEENNLPEEEPVPTDEFSQFLIKSDVIGKLARYKGGQTYQQKGFRGKCLSPQERLWRSMTRGKAGCVQVEDCCNLLYEETCLQDPSGYRDPAGFGYKELIIKEAKTYCEALELLEKASICHPYEEKDSFFCNQTIVFFLGNKGKGGVTWSRDCYKVERIVEAMIRMFKIGTTIIKIYVGTPLEFRNPKNVYRKDPNLQLTDIPTLWVWGTCKRIQGDDCLNMSKLWTLINF